ncbi:flavin monoamine oxidase family protein [Nonomuraea sp. NPDC050783]|uniref:flavin monoamine oxidase family protein n=1 Tax=Nonomuraea sp. NPDC050783 TaxID=3154634 RepID=UPI00346678B8
MIPSRPRSIRTTQAVDRLPDFPFDYGGYLGRDSSGRRKFIGTLPQVAQGTPVAIIGAGAAGLCAAYELMRIGLRPVLFEAETDASGRPRIGGRMHTYSAHPDDPAKAELGCMRFPSSATLQKGYVEDFGLTYELFPDPFVPDAVGMTTVDIGGRQYSAATIEELYLQRPDFAKIHDAWNAALDKAGFTDLANAIESGDTATVKKLWNPLVERYDHTSFYEFLAESGTMSAEQIRIFGLIGFGTGGWDSFFDISWLEMLRMLVTGMDADQMLLVEGASAFAEGFWNHAPDDIRHWPKGTSLASLHGGTPRGRVIAMEGSRLRPGQIDLTVEGSGRETFAAVLLTPQLHAVETQIMTPRNFPPDSGQIPLFGDRLWNAIHKTSYWASAKTFSLMGAPFWVDGKGTYQMGVTLSDSLPRATYVFDYGRYRPTPAGRHGASIALSYTWVEDAMKVSASSLEERVHLYARELSRIHPSLSHAIWSNCRPDNSVTISWENEPNFRGLCKFNRPGQYDLQWNLFSHFMKDQIPGEPANNLFLAGDDISWSAGWVNHALQSGLNAAWAIAKRVFGADTSANPGPGDLWKQFAPVPPTTAGDRPRRDKRRS